MHTSSSSTPGSSSGIDRRTFIGGAAAAGLLAACSSSDDAPSDGVAPDDSSGPGGPGEGGGGESSFDLVQRFPVNEATLVPGEIRLPLSLFRNAEFFNDGPDELGAQVTDLDGNPVGERITAVRRDVTPSAYYAWRPTIDAPGSYALVIDGGPSTGANFRVDEPEAVAVPRAGQQLAGIDTPTFDEPRGVDPVCTREPACPFHSLSLAEALNVDRGVVYLLGTPAFCQTGTCAPALEALVELESEFSDDFVFVHAEVFTDLTAQTYAPAVDATGVNWEPALFITDRSGQIIERIDTIWNTSELQERLQAARS